LLSPVKLSGAGEGAAIQWWELRVLRVSRQYETSTSKYRSNGDAQVQVIRALRRNGGGMYGSSAHCFLSG
jgi:hypothetical protein